MSMNVMFFVKMFTGVMMCHPDLVRLVSHQVSKMCFLIESLNTKASVFVYGTGVVPASEDLTRMC